MGEMRPEADHADKDQVERDDIVEQARHEKDHNAGDQRISGRTSKISTSMAGSDKPWLV
jgi:hypothetical protein